MFGKNTTTISRSTAAKIAEGMNCWAGKEYRNNIITADEVLRLQPVKTKEENGYVIYAFQWGDVTILAWVKPNCDVVVKHVCW